jgi:T5orf172 domain
MRETMGVVYVMTNPALPGGRKVGRTVKGADRRAVQVTREYGTTDRFVVESKHVVHNPNLVEALAHHKLRHRRVRNTEIFMVNAAEAKSAIKNAAAMALHRSLWQKVWLFLTLPRPIPRSGNSRSRPQAWGLLVALVLTAGLLWIAQAKPPLPVWLPDQLYRAAALVERI